MEAASYLLPDGCPRNPVYIVHRFLHSFLCQVVELHNVMEHAHSLIEGTVAVIRGVGILLEEVILDQLGNLKCDFVRFSKRTLLQKHVNWAYFFDYCTYQKGIYPSN